MFKENVSQCCMNCERLARELKAAKGLLANTKLALYVMVRVLDTVNLEAGKEAAKDMIADIEAFLATTPTDSVLVKKDDLKIFLRAQWSKPRYLQGPYREAYDRLNAILKEAP